MQVHMAVCHELWPIRLLRLAPTIQYIDLPVDSSGNMKGIKPLTTVLDAAKCSAGFLLQHPTTHHRSSPGVFDPLCSSVWQ